VSGTHKENQKLKQYVQQLEDENNLLKLKFEILLDMVRAVIPYDISDW
jgi:cell division protein FtsB